ncbi:alpha/beta fold hydrolase [Novosphingobium sp. AP12]|uniref:alpha/beta fold hydrolase n=1 Tax=Novosphingobium sp. AP12 TaxID=1144305 RepID=UPI0002722448|nr:alpha/beta hydrolase [Novosphingobium sp. AP12]EJL23617.1 putative hydrolase or acyltransferase of alpha/beta superfamily [Novosphingobium sp. AP12]
MRDIVFLHGGGQGSWVWDQTIAAIARQSDGAARCLALDAPGCGTKRGVDTTGYAFVDTTAELVADIEAAGLSDVMLVGHSQAGMTIPHMAELAPAGLIGKLVYVTCSAPLAGLTTLDQMGRGPRGSSPDEVGFPPVPEAERYAVMFCNDMDEAEAATFLSGLGKDGWPASAYGWSDWRYDHLRAIPSSYVIALRDMALPVEWQERFADRLHARRITRIDAGHQVMNTRQEGLAEILLAEARS